MSNSTSQEGIGGDESSPVKVLISGAGPAGLLLANHLLAHGRGHFEVHMFEKGEDPRITVERGLDNRRWSIGLYKKTECTLSLIPGLAERVRKGSVVIKGAALCTGGSKAPTLVNGRPGDFHQWIQDRVAICALMLEALVDSHADKGAAKVPGGADVTGPRLRVRFKCACTGVDLQKQTATFVNVEGDGGEGMPFTESYDLLVGADGLRSAVRGAFQQQMRDFEYEQKDLFTRWSVAHFPPPSSLSLDRTYILPVIPSSGGCTAVLMPSVHGKACLVMGWNYPDNPEEWLASDTPEKAHQFWTTRYPYLQIPKEAAWNLRSAPPQTSLQIKCSQYHDSTGHAVLIGDAAHATCPSLGIGCNSSLVDASVLGRLLCGEMVREDNRVLPVGGEDDDRLSFWGREARPEEVKSTLPQILARYSALQVNEGRAVVDLSDAFLPISAAAKTVNVVVLVALTFLSWILPFLFPRPVLDQVFNTRRNFASINNAFWWECWPLLAWKEAARREYAQAKAAQVLAKGL